MIGMRFQPAPQRESGQLAISSYDLCSLAPPAFQQLIRHS
jgi:hypothetical protein